MDCGWGSAARGASQALAGVRPREVEVGVGAGAIRASGREAVDAAVRVGAGRVPSVATSTAGAGAVARAATAALPGHDR